MIANMLNKIFNEVWPILVVFISAIILLRFFYLRNHHEKFCFHKEMSSLAAIIYIWLLFRMLTMTELNTTSGMNLVPLSEILRYNINSEMFYYSVLGNIIIFIPFGYLIEKYVSSKKIWPAVIITLFTSIVVEFVQLKIGRSFDIDDIILNLLGGIFGYLLYAGVQAIKGKLPDILKSDFIYNLVWLIIIILFVIYVFGYWGVVFS